MMIDRNVILRDRRYHQPVTQPIAGIKFVPFVILMKQGRSWSSILSQFVDLFDRVAVQITYGMQGGRIILHAGCS